MATEAAGRIENKYYFIIELGEALRKGSRTGQINPISFSQTLDAGWLALQTPVHCQVVLGGQVEATTMVMDG